MNFSFEHPYAFFALLLLIPMWLFSIYRISKLYKLFPVTFKDARSDSIRALKRFKSSRLIRLCCNSLAFLFMTIAFAGLSWGFNLVPVQKSGNAVTMVFDISYSMLTEDAPGGLTRLEAATSYAKKLMERLEGSSFSVVLAKGDGLILIPQTEDMETIFMALDRLSPFMMSSAGTSLGKGVRSGLQSFSKNLAQFKNILIFTDGDETDGQLSAALTEAVKANVPVTIIGFGSERESEIFAGDGKTRVKTALRSTNLKDCITVSAKKAGIGKMINQTAFLQYVDASEAGSALKILRTIKKDIFGSSSGESANSSAQGIAMEVQRGNRRGIFLALALIFICVGIVFSEVDIHSLRAKLKRSKAGKSVSSIMIIFSVFFLSSCNSSFNNGKKILQSSWAWHQQNYRKATAGFFQVIENSDSEKNEVFGQYALYGLATTYMMQKEDDSANTRFKQISPDAPEDVRFAAVYNQGIIAFRKGNYEEASDYFHQALLIKPASLDAKINLELSYRQQEEKPVESSEQSGNSLPQSKEQNSSVSDAIFSQLRENEENQWKSHSAQQSDNSVLDY